MIIRAWSDTRWQQSLGAGSSYGMKTHGSVVTNMAVWFTVLSPLIGLIVAFLGASLFSQSSF